MIVTFPWDAHSIDSSLKDPLAIFLIAPADFVKTGKWIVATQTSPSKNSFRLQQFQSIIYLFHYVFVIAVFDFSGF